MKKIAIISYYHKCKNYGGLLQAYALVESISKLGYSAEQICWNNITKPSKSAVIKKSIRLKKIIKHPLKLIKRIVYKFINHVLEKNIEKRSKAFEKFEKSIPHSKVEYNRDNIVESLSNYDVFITGSDQVWNMDWYMKEYFLSFVPHQMCKISYAASMPDVNLSEDNKKIIKEHLKSFNSISVREKATACFLSDILNVDVECALDPTLLLEKEDWDEICSERIINKKYIFCYFLQCSKHIKRQVKNIAKKMNIKIVTLPHLCAFEKDDIFFGDYRLYNIGPADFISLIKHAEYVITDSFHATVFSNIYKTKYFVVDRNDKINMSERFVTLHRLFGASERYLHSDAKKMYDLKNVCVEYDESIINSERKKSYDFLKKSLSMAENRIWEKQ